MYSLILLAAQALTSIMSVIASMAAGIMKLVTFFANLF